MPLVDFKDFFAGAVVDTGIKWNTGGTFSSLSCENGNLIFWPLYSGLPYNDYSEAVSSVEPLSYIHYLTFSGIIGI